MRRVALDEPGRRPGRQDELRPARRSGSTSEDPGELGEQRASSSSVSCTGHSCAPSGDDGLGELRDRVVGDDAASRARRRPRAMSLIQTSAFSPVCSRYARWPPRSIEYPPTSLIASVAPANSSGGGRRGSASRRRRRSPRRRRTRRRGRARAARPRRGCRRATSRIMASMSFMSTAPRPQSMPSRMTPPNGSTSSSRVGRHDVEVTVHDERGRSGSAPGDAGDHARAAGAAIEVPGSRPSAAVSSPTYSAASVSPLLRPPPQLSCRSG